MTQQKIFIFALILTIYFTQFSQAEEKRHSADQIIGNPPNVLMFRGGAKVDGLDALAESGRDLVPDPGEVLLNLDIKETPGEIFNPATGKFDTVLLRAYRGGNNDPNVPFIAPTIMIIPGDTVRINLNNQLDPNDPSCKDVHDVNKPHCFNSTNLHSHGLWISPAGNSDNVLIKIDPGVNFTYEWNIPLDHPAGTFWYHPHLHGSTALQVSSGMAGALIIKGDRVPTVNKNGDIDTLLRYKNVSAYADRLLVFEQIQYACRDEEGNIKTNAKGEWVCDPGDVGEISGYDQFGPTTWKASGRYTTINGRVMPTFKSTVGKIERWRFVHAGVRETIRPSFHKSSAKAGGLVSAYGFSAAFEKGKAAYIDSNCSGSQATQLSLAMDGLTRDRLVEQTEGVLQPGYREDLLMVFPEPGIYCIIDGEASQGTINGINEDRSILGFVRVSDSKHKVDNVIAYVKRRLISSAKKYMPANVRHSIITDLKKNLGLKKFVDHPSIPASEVTGKQTLAFNISTPPKVEETVFEVGNLNAAQKPVNLKSYAPDRVDRDLVLGTVDEWALKSFFNESNTVNVGHPFHIHVNPFQIISIKDKDGNELSGYEPGNRSQYARLKGVWKDTLFIEAIDHEVILRTRYERYIGEYVLHCHILDHEDQGMMQNVRISIPDSSGRPAKAHGLSH